MIRAIVTAMLPEAETHHGHARAVDDTVIFVEGQIGRMPQYLRWGFRALQLYLELASIPRAGMIFRFSNESHRRRRVQQWRNSRWRFQRDFVRLISSSALLRYYDHDLMIPRTIDHA
jgi:hypothetical protein